MKRNGLIAAVLSFWLVSVSHAHSEDASAYPDIWGRSLVELGVIPADPKQRIDLGIGGRGVYSVDGDIVVEVSVKRDNYRKYRVHFFSGAVTQHKIDDRVPDGYKIIKKRNYINDHKDLFIIGYTNCSRGSRLMGGVSFRHGGNRDYKYLAYRLYLKKEPSIVEGEYSLACQEGRETPPPGTLPYRTWTPIASTEPDIIDLGDGTVLAWSEPFDIIRFRLDGTTPYRPRDIAILDGREVDDLLAKSSYEPRKIHAALDALLKSRGY